VKIRFDAALEAGEFSGSLSFVTFSEAGRVGCPYGLGRELRVTVPARSPVWGLVALLGVLACDGSGEGGSSSACAAVASRSSPASPTEETPLDPRRDPSRTAEPQLELLPAYLGVSVPTGDPPVVYLARDPGAADWTHLCDALTGPSASALSEAPPGTLFSVVGRRGRVVPGAVGGHRTLHECRVDAVVSSRDGLVAQLPGAIGPVFIGMSRLAFARAIDVPEDEVPPDTEGHVRRVGPWAVIFRDAWLQFAAIDEAAVPALQRPSPETAELNVYGSFRLSDPGCDRPAWAGRWALQDGWMMSTETQQRIAFVNALVSGSTRRARTCGAARALSP